MFNPEKKSVKIQPSKNKRKEREKNIFYRAVEILLKD